MIFRVFSDIPDIMAGVLGKPFDGKKDAIQLIFPSKQWKKIHQVHGNSVVSFDSIQDGVSEADGMYTSKSFQGCAVLLADCIGAFFYHTKTKEIAAVHAGWRGLSQKIFSQYLSRFSNPEYIRVALSPSLGPCCSEFSDPYTETPPFFHQSVTEKNGKYFVDLWEIAKHELLQNGILLKNIEMPSCCTKCNKQFWSHRRGDIQRNIGFIYTL